MPIFVICDDNSQYLDNMETVLKGIADVYPIRGVQTFNTPGLFLKYLDAVKPSEKHVFILDVDLKSDYTGFDLAEMIRERELPADIIIVTAYTDCLLQAYKVRAFDYIIKKSSFDEDLRKSIQRLLLIQ